ncbi:hypothetical protein [Accumulibacter sp.]|uniref:hypothetical protein n=1 Tax=Accumulibacter sp. TaxID=2053492 RepID=UPI0028C3790A|nr:hypothetical protein [Accumulibacter sp.]
MLTLAATPVGAGAPAADVVVLPPVFEAHSSPAGTYVLEIRLREDANPHLARATATLFRVTSSKRQAVWTRELPHRPRPRFFAVGDGGQVVLLDEWLNIRSELAVMVLDLAGCTLVQFDLEAVRAALGVPISALAPAARHGVWMQAPPVINARGDAVEVAAANRVLSIRLSDGKLSAH